jgi:hypothetical protein
MKQWVLAAHNHHDAHKKFPTQQSASVTTHTDWSATAALLPFMEATNLFESLKAKLEPFDPTDPPNNPRFINFAAVLCPSDPTARTLSPNGAKGNISVSYGDGSLQANGSITSLSHAQSVMSRGFYVARATRTVADVTDGMSNTIAISESVTGSSDNLSNVRGGIDKTGTSIQQGSANEIIPANCLNNAINPANRNQILNPYIHADRRRSARYLDGRHFYTGFNTILPPNSPNCSRQSPTGGDTNAESAWAIYSSSSFHTGGVNCGIGDGAVRFINENIDTNGLPNSPQGQALRGKSRFGIWGALGTPKGGETVTLP